ncbi:MAG TPA: hypothetical protein VHB02_19590 [Acidimicrobiales bacterium]|nr:hypothetical protein [Acidimicrobiales bacterium]
MALAKPEPTPTVHSLEELRSSTANVVEEARHRIVHLRVDDDDGLVLLAEEQYEEIVRWIRAVLVASRAIGMPEAERQPGAFGDSPWLAVFDDEDLTTFVEEMGKAIFDVLGSTAGTVDGLRTVGQEWRTTATVLADPVSREVLLGRHDVDDFIEISRPT